MISPSLKDKVKRSILQKISSDIEVLDYVPVSGGCISQTFKIVTSDRDFFLKFNDSFFGKMFDCEANGLDLLRVSADNSIFVPEVVDFSDDYLLMDFIDESPVSNNFWDSFGYGLSAIHKNYNSHFGLDHDNYIGSLIQENKMFNSWSDFFINQRIIPQIKQGNFSSDLKRFDDLFLRIESIFPVEKPSLLHGDLWNGNYLIFNGNPCLIDPSVYFGFREMDIAMTKLFGGFSDRFYDSYNDSYPLAYEWQDRLDLCNLYPLLVHANLFGGSYYNRVKEIVRYFTSV